MPKTAASCTPNTERTWRGPLVMPLITMPVSLVQPFRTRSCQPYDYEIPRFWGKVGESDLSTLSALPKFNVDSVDSIDSDGGCRTETLRMAKAMPDNGIIIVPFKN